MVVGMALVPQHLDGHDMRTPRVHGANTVSHGEGSASTSSSIGRGAAGLPLDLEMPSVACVGRASVRAAWAEERAAKLK
eukprot:13705711-Alexandrium_andersonii.AAC.1